MPDRLDDARAELEALADNLSRYLGAEITVSDLITADHREVVLED